MMTLFHHRSSPKPSSTTAASKDAPATSATPRSSITKDILSNLPGTPSKSRSASATPSGSTTPVKSNFEEQNEGNLWAGHMGHLTPEQEQTFVEFKKACAETGTYTPEDVEKGLKPSHDDKTMLRFLRARKFEILGAVKQFTDTEKWRADNKIHDLYELIDVAEYNQARTVYPQWTGRRDKRGLPVYVQVLSALTDDNMSQFVAPSESINLIEADAVGNTPAGSSTLEERHSKGTGTPKRSRSPPPRLLKLFALYENMTEFVLPLCDSVADRPDPHRPISGTVNIADVSNTGLLRFWNLKAHMQDASVLATAHYPETLDRIFIVGAPSFFPTVWGWIKRWFDPVTTSKIVIVPASEVESTLTTYIDPENLPRKYGGTMDWELGMEPDLDPQMKALYGDKPWVPGPVRWIKGEGPQVCGSVGGIKRTN